MINKILIVDYSVLRQEMYGLVMNRYNCPIVTASNGQAALDLLDDQQEIDLILLDINIAGMSGIAFLEKIAQSGILKRVPVILISSAGREEEVIRGINLGARESLKRPFRPSLLHEIMEKIAQEKESEVFEKSSYQQEGAEMMSNSAQEIITERVYWRGALTQSMSLNLGGELLNGLKRCHTLIVDLEGVDLMDYSCLVLLCAVKRQANEKGKDICLEGVKNRAVAPLIERFRINGNQLCRAYCGNSCLFD